MGQRQLKMLLDNWNSQMAATEAEIRPYQKEDRERLKDVLIPLTEHRFSDEELDNVILKNPRVREDAVFTAWLAGKMVGTTTACLDQATGMGEIHMVSVLAEASGHRIGQLLVNAAVRYLKARDELAKICLTTDDFRLPAISIYLRVGFHPVVDDEEMIARWQRILANLSVEQIQGFSSLESAKPSIELHAEK